jgi:cell division protein ZapA (FtsZ GTPase activity inhibitor)
MIKFLESLTSSEKTNFLPPSELIEAITDSTEYLYEAMEELGDQTSYAREQFEGLKNTSDYFAKIFVGSAKSPGFINGLVGGKARPVTVIDEIVLGMKGMNDFITKIVSQQSPLQRIANTFQDLAESMGEYVDAVNEINIAKMTSLNDQLKIMQKFNQPGLAENFQAVKEVVNKLIELEEAKSSSGSLVDIEVGTGGGGKSEISEASMNQLAERIARAMTGMKVIISDPNTGRSLGVVGRIGND